MPYVFGKGFDVPLQVLAGEESVSIASLTSARVYSSTPTDAQKADHTYVNADAVASSTTFVSNGKNRYSVTFAAIADPSPASTNEKEIYYIAFSVKYQISGDNVCLVEPVYIYRGAGMTSVFGLEPTDLIELDRELDDLMPLGDIDKKIKVAVRRVIKKYRGMGRTRTRLAEADLFDAVRFLALAYCYRDLNRIDKMTSYFEEYGAVFSDTPVGYDGDGDGLIDPSAPDEQLNSVFQLMQR